MDLARKRISFKRSPSKVSSASQVSRALRIRLASKWKLLWFKSTSSAPFWWIKGSLISEFGFFWIMRWTFFSSGKFKNLTAFREGYLRMSSADYATDRLTDDYVHLTNNAIQKNCPDYGKQEDGNQLSFNDLRNYMRKESVNSNRSMDFDKDIVPRMKYQAATALQSVSAIP